MYTFTMCFLVLLKNGSLRLQLALVVYYDCSRGAGVHISPATWLSTSMVLAVAYNSACSSAVSTALHARPCERADKCTAAAAR